MKRPDLDIGGCFSFFGEHIRLCIEDYAQVHNNQVSISRYILRLRSGVQNKFVKGRIARARAFIRNYEEAKQYIFGGKLKRDIEVLHLPLELECVQTEARLLSEKMPFPLLTREGKDVRQN